MAGLIELRLPLSIRPLQSAVHNNLMRSDCSLCLQTRTFTRSMTSAGSYHHPTTLEAVPSIAHRKQTSKNLNPHSPPVPGTKGVSLGRSPCPLSGPPGAAWQRPVAQSPPGTRSDASEGMSVSRASTHDPGSSSLQVRCPASSPKLVLRLKRR